MPKKSKRRSWSAADVRTLKTAAKKKTRAASIARTLKRTEGLLGKKHSVSACPSIHEPDMNSVQPAKRSPARAGLFL